MQHLRKLFGACVSAMLLSACGGGSAALAPTAARQNLIVAMGPTISAPCFGGCIYVSNSRKFGGKARLLSYPVTAKGEVEPVAEITGSATGLLRDLGMAVDASRRIYTGSFKRNDVLVFAAGASGNVPPVRVIRGSNTLLSFLHGIAVDGGNNIYAANDVTGSVGDILVFAAGANGNAAPIRNIAGSNTKLDFPEAVTLDGSNNVYVTNIGTPSVTVFAAGADGNVSPIQAISGSNTLLNHPEGVAVDGDLNIYVADFYASRISVFGAGANGNVAPVRTIAGSRTKLGNPYGIALDAAGNIYVANNVRYHNYILVFAAGANGNVKPIRTIRGDAGGKNNGNVYGIAVR